MIGIPESGAAAPPRASAKFDRAAFEAILAKPYRHRQVFGSVKLADAAVLHYMENALTAYSEGFGEGPGTLHVAAVLYGQSLVVAAPSSLWKTYSLAKYLATYGEHFDTGIGTVNPHAARVARLRDAGASFFVCDNALRGFTQALGASPSGGDGGPDEVYAAFHAALSAERGVTIVPAGVAALNAAQEARFTLCHATLA